MVIDADERVLVMKDEDPVHLPGCENQGQEELQDFNKCIVSSGTAVGQGVCEEEQANEKRGRAAGDETNEQSRSCSAMLGTWAPARRRQGRDVFLTRCATEEPVFDGSSPSLSVSLHLSRGV